jgi:plasmid stabilization system protein ParE
MPRGDKGSYTDKQKRKAEHIEEGYEKKGVSEKEAAARAWATVNKESGGGKKSGSGRGKKENRSASKKGGKKAAKKSSKKAAKKSSKKSSKK